LNFARIIAQIDTFERSTIVFIIVALIVLPAVGRWMTEHDDESDGRRAAIFLAGLTALGTVVIIAAAVFGPHPA
jgi:hypothetical protein